MKIKKLNLPRHALKIRDMYAPHAHKNIIFSFIFIGEVYLDTPWSIKNDNDEFKLSDFMYQLSLWQNEKIGDLAKKQILSSYDLDESKNNTSCFILLKKDMENHSWPLPLNRLKFDTNVYSGARIYGILEGEVFYILLWDKNHTIFPDTKRFSSKNSLCFITQCSNCEIKNICKKQ